jgi:acetyltransferase-like isoleucine patch superfamily enzyme
VTHTGRIGENAAVEAPFTCDYGYNIQIGDNVAIGRNCLINDVCEVKIGNNVIISPNVSVYTGSCTTDFRRRQGNRGTQYGKPIVIEDDVWIGANCVLLPGVTVGRGSTVGAGSIVTKVCASRYLSPLILCVL